MFRRSFAVHASAVLSILSLSLPARGQCEPEWIPTGYGQNITGTVQCFAQFDPDGAGPRPLSLIAGGFSLRRPGMLRHHKLLAYDGSDWGMLEADVPQSGGAVYEMTVYNGQLIVAGEFSTVGGVTANGIAAWNGTTWSALGSGITGGQVKSLAVVSGFLFVGGNFSTAGGLSTPGIARWDGSNWEYVGGVSASGSINALVGFNGQLYAGGQFSSIGGVAAANLASYGPTSGVWSPAGNPNGTVLTLAQYSALAVTSSRLYVGGTFSLVDGVAVSNAARFTPVLNSWVNLGSPAGATACTKLFVRSTGISSHQTSGLWRGSFDSTAQAFVLSGTAWNTLNSVPLPRCTAMTYYAGQFTLGRTSSSDSSIMRWDGTAWKPMGNGAAGLIRSLCAEGNSGDVIAGLQLDSTAGSSFAGVARRSAATGVWTQLGEPFDHSSTLTRVNAVAVRPNGEVYAGGIFNTVGTTSIPFLARWNGSAWSQVGSGVSGSVHSLLTMPNGDVIVGGAFSQAGGFLTGGIARWNGSAWFPVGSGIPGTVLTTALLPNGELVAGGLFSGVGLSNNVARWNGTTWLPLGTGTNGFVYCVAPAPNGGVYVGGDFTIAGTVAAANIARWDGGNNWSALGSGLGGTYPWPYTMALLEDSSLIVGGDFATAGGNPITYLARWNGSTWSAVGAGISGGYVSSVVKLPTGDLAISGAFTHANNLPSAYLALWGVPDGCSDCDSIDFNNDTSLFDPQDIEAFLSVYSEGPCIPGTATCNDIDFNNDSSLFDPCDIDAFLLVFSEGPCTACGT